MIIFYRAVAFFLLVGCISSLLSFLAFSIPDLRRPMFYLVVMFCLVCGVVTANLYYKKKDDNNDWMMTLYVLIGFAIAVIFGGVIQW